MKKTRTSVVKRSHSEFSTKKWLPGKIPDSQSLLFDHNSILKRNCVKETVQLLDHVKSI